MNSQTIQIYCMLLSEYQTQIFAQLLIFSVPFQGWLLTRPVAEQAVFMDLFENSFPILYRQAIQNWTFKMDVLEAFVIAQVSLYTGCPETTNMT